MLKGYDGDGCILGDLVARLPLETREEIDRMLTYMREQSIGLDKANHQEKQVAFIRQAAKILRAGAKKACWHSPQWCYRHHRECPVTPRCPPSVVRVNVAGICCQDWSIRGKQAGSLGETIWPWCGYVFSIMLDEPDIVICECTQLYRHEDLEVCLGESYTIAHAVFTVSDLGIPCQRVRKYMVLIHRHGKLAWKHQMSFRKDRLLELFGRQVRCNGHIFLDHTPKELRRQYLDDLVAGKHLPARDGRGQRWHQKALLTKPGAQRLSEYEEAAKKRGLPEKAEVFCDITQNPEYGSITALVPALLRNSSPWSLKYDREMIPAERLEAMGLACILPEQTVGCKTVCGDIISALKPAQVKSMAGNAMHVAAIGVVLIYSLARTEFVDTEDEGQW